MGNFERVGISNGSFVAFLQRPEAPHVIKKPNVLPLEFSAERACKKASAMNDADVFFGDDSTSAGQCPMTIKPEADAPQTFPGLDRMPMDAGCPQPFRDV